MSCVKAYKGKLIKLEKHYGETLESQCKRILQEKNTSFELDNYYDSYVEYLKDEMSDKYYIYKDNIYAISNKKELDPNELFEGNKNENSDIEFLVSYYNGSCCLSEALDSVMMKINK